MVSYNVEGVKMPKIKKRETTAWIRAVAASYGSGHFTGYHSYECREVRQGL